MFQLIARQVRGGTLSALLASAALMIPALPAVAGQTDSYTPATTILQSVQGP